MTRRILLAFLLSIACAGFAVSTAIAVTPPKKPAKKVAVKPQPKKVAPKPKPKPAPEKAYDCTQLVPLATIKAITGISGYKLRRKAISPPVTTCDYSDPTEREYFFNIIVKWKGGAGYYDGMHKTSIMVAKKYVVSSDCTDGRWYPACTGVIDIPDIGDEAYSYGRSFHVRRGDMMLSLQAADKLAGPRVPSPEQFRTIANKILAQVKK